jgi:hypothetical protein
MLSDDTAVTYIIYPCIHITHYTYMYTLYFPMCNCLLAWNKFKFSNFASFPSLVHAVPWEFFIQCCKSCMHPNFTCLSCRVLKILLLSEQSRAESNDYLNSSYKPITPTHKLLDRNVTIILGILFYNHTYSQLKFYCRIINPSERSEEGLY